MFAKTLGLAAAALLAATAAQAHPEPAQDSVRATYHFNTKRFCVRTDDLEAAERGGMRVRPRQCLSRQKWRERGIRFVPPQRSIVVQA